MLTSTFLILFQVPTGITGKPESPYFLSKLIGRKILNVDGEDEVKTAGFFLHNHKFDKYKKFLPTAPYKFHGDSLYHQQLNKLKKLSNTLG